MIIIVIDISDKLLNSDTAGEIYATCSEMLQAKTFSTRGILQRMNVKVVCTTGDPVDALEHHQQIKEDESVTIKILPAFRPDKAMGVESPEALNQWVDKLEAAADVHINEYTS